MSFSANGTVVNGDIETLTKSPEVLPEYNSDMLEAALTAISDLLESGVLGTSDKTYRWSVSGHGNINHEPASGWSNDSMSISISQQ